MKWDKYTIETTTEAEDYISCTLADLGIEGIEIEDNVPLSESDTSKMFIDILPELPPDQGIGYVSFYLEAGEDHSEKLKEVAEALEEMRSYVNIGSGKITSSENRIRLIENLFSVFIALMVMLSIKWVGILIINALLILPAASSRNISENLREYHFFSILYSVFSGIVGLFISYYTNVATGPMIVIIASVIFFATYFYGRNR